MQHAPEQRLGRHLDGGGPARRLGQAVRSAARPNIGATTGAGFTVELDDAGCRVECWVALRLTQPTAGWLEGWNMNWRYQAVVDDRDYTTHFLVSDAGERIHVWYMLFWRFAFDEAQKDVRFGAFRTSARAPMSEIEERSLGPNCEVRLLKKWPGNNQPLNVLSPDHAPGRWR